MAPTINAPWVVNPDGSVDVLVWQGRVWQARVTHLGLTDPAGWKARVAFGSAYGGTLLASGSTEDGRVTLSALPDAAGTLIAVDLPDEATEQVTARKGVWDLVLESPGGAETAVLAGAFVTRLRVSP